MLTFAIPFYSGVEYLRRAISSVLAQDISDWRLIVCDDAGPDPEASQVVSSFNDHRMFYIRNATNLGLAGNWNRCLELAETELVTLLHGDDELRPGYGRMMCDAAKEYPEAVVFGCPADVIDSNGDPATSIPDTVKRVLSPRTNVPVSVMGENSLMALLRANFIVCPALCYVRAKLRRPLFDNHWNHVMDLAMTARLLLDGQSLVWLPHREYLYRRHARNMTTMNTESAVRFVEMAELYARIRTEASDKGWTRAAEVARKMSIVKLNLVYCLLSDMFHLHLPVARGKWRVLRGLFG